MCLGKEAKGNLNKTSRFKNAKPSVALSRTQHQGVRESGHLIGASTKWHGDASSRWPPRQRRETAAPEEAPAAEGRVGGAGFQERVGRGADPRRATSLGRIGQALRSPIGQSLRSPIGQALRSPSCHSTPADGMDIKHLIREHFMPDICVLETLIRGGCFYSDNGAPVG